MDDINKRKTHITSALETLRKRLLDLTARNRLLNFTHTKGASLRIIDELPDQLREVLLSEEELRFLPVPEPTREQLIEAGYVEIDPETGQENTLKKDPKADEWARWLGLKTGYDLPEPIKNLPGEEKHQDLAIQTLLFPYELETRLRGLRTKSVTAIEESGANILYMAFGFLEWHESTDSDKMRLAPLLLLPVRLQKGRLNPETRTYDYTLSYSGEDILPNLSLREKLKIDYGLALPDLDEETEPEVYFEEVRRLIKDNQPRWSVRRYATLSLLNFSKLLMYLDLDPERWPADNPITDHPIVDKFLSGSESDEQESNGEGYAGEEYLIDEIPDVHQLYPLVEDADSSQHSALKDALDGGNLVIEGPVWCKYSNEPYDIVIEQY